MIITILCLLLFVVSTILLEVFIHNYNEPPFRLFHVVLAFLLIPLGIVAYVKTTEKLEYEKTQFERQQLIEEYENGNQFAYDDIIAFDKDLKDYKFWGSNPLVNWFYNQSIVEDVDYILYEKGE